MEASMKAYLDDFNKLNVVISHRFYNGKTNGFYLKRSDGLVMECQIKSILEQNGYTQYEVVFEGEYDFSKRYTVYESHCHQATVEVRYLVHTKRFEELFYYDGKDLGSHYTKEATSFALWAPTAIYAAVHINDEIYTMEKTEKGVFRATVYKDLDGAKYRYYVDVNGHIVETTDPYAISGFANGKASAVINPEKLVKKQSYTLEPMNSYTDAIIYELSVRDFTSDITACTSSHSLFKSMLEEGTTFKGLPTAFDYLKSLNVTHVQLLPVTDFATVDEENPRRAYNWGYDPLQWGVLEGSYSSNPNDPYSRVNEFIELVNTLHVHGMRVNLDVVFNHHYDLSMSNLNLIVPYYFFRYSDQKYLSNGSFCGNDTESRRLMMRKFMLDTIEKFITLYDIDGLRFDLMGIHDIVTMNEIYKLASSYKCDFMVYGEGWNMPTAMSDDEKATLYNNYQMPHIAFFNDFFRDVVKGKTSVEESYAKGYITGNLNLMFEYKSALLGNSIDGYHKIYLSPTQSINYVECHDNATSWDKIDDCCKEDVNQIRILKHKLLLATTMIAQGVPFIHSGQEFARTKLGMHNTYNTMDDINKLDYNRLNRYQMIYDYFRDLVTLRRRHKCFRLSNTEDIFKYVEFESYDDLLVYSIMEEDHTIVCFINPTSSEITYAKQGTLIFNEHGLVNDKAVDHVDIKPYSISILKCKHEAVS